MAVVLAVPLLIILTAYVAYALANLQHSQSTGFLGWLAQAAGNLPIFGGFSARQILKLDQWMTHMLGRHFKQVERKAVAWLVGLKQYAGWMAASAVYPAVAAAQFARWLLHSELPRQITGRTKHTTQTAEHADATAAKAAKAASDVAKSHPGKVTARQVTKIERVAMPHAEEWSWINHHWKALQHAVTHPGVILPGLALPVPLRWFGRTTKQLRAHNRRLARLEKLIGVTAFAAVMARVLGVTPRCLRSGNVGKVARRLCGLTPRALEDLLGLIADALILANICQVITVLQDALAFIEPEITAFITAAEAWACYGNTEHPPDTTAIALNLPPLRPIALALP